MGKICLIIFSFLLPAAALCQQKAFVSTPYAVLIDTTTKRFETYTASTFSVNHSLFIGGTYTRLMDIYDGLIFCFSDTIVSGDVAQQGTSGIFKITPHAAVVSTTKRNILVRDILLSYNTATQTLVTPLSYGEPLKIINTSTGRVSVSIYMNGTIFWDVLPTLSNITSFGVGNIKKIVVN